MLGLSPILIEETILGAAVAFVLALAVIMSIAFSYHWKRFGIPAPLFYRMNRLYFFVAGGLAIASLLLYLAITA